MVLPLWHALIVLILTFKLLWIKASAKWLHVNVALLHLSECLCRGFVYDWTWCCNVLNCLAVEFPALRASGYGKDARVVIVSLSR